MTRKHITFTAPFVSCSEAMDEEILQVRFDSMAEDSSEDTRTTPYFLLSISFEFSNKATAEFYDGSQHDGSKAIIFFELNRTKAKATLETGPIFEMDFQISDPEFSKLKEYLGRMVPDQLTFHCI